MPCIVEDANRFRVKHRPNRGRRDDGPNARNLFVPFHIARLLH